MKYLQDNQLAQWTAALTEVPIGHCRILNGRLEVYSMKRATSDKKYAAVLGEKYVEQIQQDQDSMAEVPLMPIMRGRKRSQSEGVLAESSFRSASSSTSTGKDKSVVFSAHESAPEETELPPKKRSRSCSLDEGLPKTQLTALGDFNEQGTRRLMTDLVLTLNASFPDYDFGSIKPTDFVKLPAKKAARRINESLSEWAVSSASTTSSNNLNHMWKDVDEAIALNECDVYKFIPTEDASFLLPSYDGEEEVATYEDSSAAIPEGGGDSGASNQEAILWSFSYLFVNKQMKRIVLFSCAESMRQHSVSLYSEEDENDAERFIQFADTRGTGNVDFDLDPEQKAGGIPVSNI
mmetsp:Transcript_25795/g.53771  ORF Transcript_25795/g.53771 Transcript_25795/m.53771 type:complete len:350 (+) Transcript_25795:280-1329(+)